MPSKRELCAQTSIGDAATCFASSASYTKVNRFYVSRFPPRALEDRDKAAREIQDIINQTIKVRRRP